MRRSEALVGVIGEGERWWWCLNERESDGRVGVGGRRGYRGIGSNAGCQLIIARPRCV